MREIKSKLTPKDNFLRVLRGEIPESIPLQNMGFTGYNGEATYRIIGPSLFDETHLTPCPNGRVDIWGVNYVTSESTGFGAIPEPGNFLLEDVTQWRKIIHAPDIPKDIDWEVLAKRDWEASGIDYNQSAAMAVVGLMPFQQFIAFMGFEEGLCAMFEEPEEVSALLHYMADVYEPIVEKTAEYYQADCVYFLDDTASKYNPFISKKMFDEILMPVYRRLTKPFREREIPIQFHNCGRCEDFIEDIVSLGVKVMDPMQTTNDLLAIKEKYGNKLVMAGCFDWTPPLTWPEVDEEEIRQGVRDMVDTFAPGGGYMARAGALGVPGDEVTAQVNQWLTEEVYWYTRDYYLDH